jgi:uncharacterized protein (TIGR03435 family)
MIRPLIIWERFWGTVLAALICCEFAIGQVADKRWEFEVASVKPAPPYHGEATFPRGGPGTSDPGQVTYERTWLPNLAADAYQVRLDQVSAPAWMKSEAYSIVAKIPPNTTKDQFHLMLQNLLAERFHLRLHHETKTLPVYILSVAPGGPRLKPASTDPNVAAAAPATPTCEASEKNHFPELGPGRTEAHRWCEFVDREDSMAYYTYRQTMAEFAPGLGILVSMSNGDGIIGGGPPVPFVVDETGLAGRFEFTLEFAGSIVPSSPAVVRAMIASGDIRPVDPSQPQPSPEEIADGARGRGPNIFTALEKQLGLKLEKGKRPVDFLVIDHADKVPTEN